MNLHSIPVRKSKLMLINEKLTAWNQEYNNFPMRPLGWKSTEILFYYDESDGVLIGEEAEESGQGNQAKNLKREIKLELNSTFIADGKVFSVKEIVGYILDYVKEWSLQVAKTKLIDESLEGVVISVPAAFEHNEKAFIREDVV